MNEEWRKIPGFKRTYEVSNLGEVRSNSEMARGQTLRARIHKFTGFPQVRIMGAKGKRQWWPIHELVAKAFPEEDK
ncbi:NUMOD4 domain-containing protein [Streptomyces sp. bgisy153]|uniref:NUMOD4 domain-containing protein n=1 Tax=Streptomyces sp. bgisy153 TaxID=3413793 RepID=UPI003D74A3AF